MNKDGVAKLYKYINKIHNLRYILSFELIDLFERLRRVAF